MSFHRDKSLYTIQLELKMLIYIYNYAYKCTQIETLYYYYTNPL